MNFGSKGKVQRHSSWELLPALTPDSQGMGSHLLSMLEEKLDYWLCILDPHALTMTVTSTAGILGIMTFIPLRFQLETFVEVLMISSSSSPIVVSEIK